jgi:cyanate permease
MAHFGAILGASGLFSSLGQVVGPYLTGWLYDATGGYDAALMMFIGAYGLAGLSFMAMGVMTRRK